MKLNIDEIKSRNRFRKDVGDIDSLAASIRDVGLLHPIVVDADYRLIAGARRLQCWKKYRGEFGDKIPATIVKTLDEACALLRAERDENTCRQDFLPSEAVALGQQLEKLERPKAKERQVSVGGRNNARSNGRGKLPQPLTGKTRDKVAVGMSGKTYEKAKAVVSSGDAELVTKMDETGNVDRAFKLMKQREKEQADAAAAKKAAKAIKSTKENENGVYHGDSFELATSIPDATCALIFTDPPYDRASLPLYGQLAELAGRILVDGGSLITYLPQYLLPDVITSLATETLRYFWCNCCLHTGDTASMREYGIKVRWKPMLWFVKGKFRRDRETWVDDLVTSQQEKEHHPWQQSVVEAEYYIARLTKKRELVVDPFCGGGTTAYAAKIHHREWWTADINATHVQTARDRLK